MALLAANFYLAVMVYPVETFRTANGLFTQGWARPLATAGINLALDAALGRCWGLNGILAATAAARVLTQVWFDPWLIYRRVFRRDVRRYYGRYALRAAFAALACAVAAAAAAAFPFSNRWIGFAFRAAAAFLVPNLMLLIFWYKDPGARAMARRLLRGARTALRRAKSR